MSQKRKNQRANHAAKEEAQGKKVVFWIFGVLIVLALVYMIYTFSLM